MSQSTLPSDHGERMQRVLLALDGLSVGDAFGQQFFYAPNVETLIAQRAEPRPPWHYTDDTEMALAITQVLNEEGRIDQDRLAHLFALRYSLNPARGYGGTAMGILENIGEGVPWQHISRRVFEGQGSMGNGGAMRVAPVGAYFAEDLPRLVREARASAEVTHAHPEGQAGAIAIAVASAWAHRWHSDRMPVESLFETVLEHTPQGETRAGIERARAMDLSLSPETAASVLGNGSRVISQDTVSFCLWCAARHADDYTEAMWTTVAGLGDRDTTCAIVGGIVALSAGRESIPGEWLRSREELGMWV